MEGTTVVTTDGECTPFKPSKIKNVLIKESGLDEEHAKRITERIAKKIREFRHDGINTLSTNQIRTMVNYHLINDHKFSEEFDHERVGISVASLKGLLEGHSTDNANLQRNPETIHKFVADVPLKEFALKSLPHRLANAHISGDLHIHDLEYFSARPVNCLQHDLRWFIKEGLKVDGTGDHTSVAKPPKRMETLANHSGEIMLAGQQNCSGGQGMSLWNVFAAPFCLGLSYDEIKRYMQMLIFNLNMAYSNRGGQVPFTSLNLEFTVPQFLRDEPAYGPGGQTYGTYGDWEEETRLLQRAFTEVLMEGDAVGKPHLFPNTIYVIREEMMKSEFDEDLETVHELASKFSTPYFANTLPEWTGGHSNVMGCRTRLNTNWTGDWEMDTLRTGNLAYVTLNLPRLAYKSSTDDEFFERLDHLLDTGKEILMIRRQQALKCLDSHLPFLTMKNKEGEQYYRIEHSTMSFGFGGLHEALMAMGYVDGIVSSDGKVFGEKILKHLNNYAKEQQVETGLRWTILQTPGETCNHRFATKDKELYPRNALVNGKKGSHYYTNSSHYPVDADVDLVKRILGESRFHPLTAGGHIFHAWLGESYSDPLALTSLTKTMAKKSDMGFWAYSSAFSFCFNCDTLMRGLPDQCGVCGSGDGVEHYDRITGYIQQVGNKKSSSGGWNPGKRAELKDRHRYTVT